MSNPLPNSAPVAPVIAVKLPPVHEILASDLSSMDKASRLANKWWFESPAQLEDLEKLLTEMILTYEAVQIGRFLDEHHL
jgi:predicted unusual protein kinase regulating ubiquinone biosynthesis (AarF/ABC1/UbiB family)